MGRWHCGALLTVVAGEGRTGRLESRKGLAIKENREGLEPTTQVNRWSSHRTGVLAYGHKRDKERTCSKEK